MNMNKKIICLWGQPSAGKSTTCLGLGYKLKLKGYSCELNREYVKDWVWEGREIKEGDQSYIFTKQARKERFYMNNYLDFIITDSPMGLCVYYGRKHDRFEHEHNACIALLKQHHDYCKDKGYKVDHYYLPRLKKYDPKGRFQTEEDADKIAKELLEFMVEMNINFKTINVTQEQFDANEDIVVKEILNNYI